MASVGRGESVSCVISPTIVSSGKEYCATSIQDFKIAVYNDKSWMVSHEDWLEAALVCRKDGHEINDMATLKQHLVDGCKHMILVSETCSIPIFRSYNVDLCAKLYRELEKIPGGSVLNNVGCWTKERLDDLETLSMVSPRSLAEELSMTVGEVCALQFRISDIIEKLETLGYY